MALNATGNPADSPQLFIADSENNRIRKVSANGIITTVAGDGSSPSLFSGDGGPATNAQLRLAGFTSAGVAVDCAGNLFIADTSNYRIRKVSTNGTITTVAGNGMRGFSGDGGPATSAQVAFPSALAVDGEGNLFIADSGNSRTRKVSPNGIITTLAPASGFLAVDRAGSSSTSRWGSNRFEESYLRGTVPALSNKGWGRIRVPKSFDRDIEEATT
ncbi:MAG: hypothetical protein ABIZ80_19900 [Bryobacteraceae bacterium]